MPSFTSKLQSFCTRMVRSSKLSPKKGSSPDSSQQGTKLDENCVDFQPKYLGDYSDYVSSRGSSASTSSLSSIQSIPEIAFTKSTRPPISMERYRELMMESHSTTTCSNSRGSLSALSNSNSDSELSCQRPVPIVRQPVKTQLKPKCTSRHHLGPCESWVTFEFNFSDSDAESASIHEPCTVDRPDSLLPYLPSLLHDESTALPVTPTPSLEARQSHRHAHAHPATLSVASHYSVQKPVEPRPHSLRVDFTFPSYAHTVFPMPMLMHLPKKASAFRTVCASESTIPLSILAEELRLRDLHV